MEKEPNVHIGIGYGGAVKITATVDGEACLIEKEEAERILDWVIRDGKTLKTKTKRMIYPRLEFTQEKAL